MNPIELLDRYKSGDLRRLYSEGTLFPEFRAMKGCMQHSVHHKEGDVLTHTDLVVEEMDKMDILPGLNAVLKFAALCHDIGKPAVTVWNAEKEEFTAYKHASAGVDPSRAFLSQYDIPAVIIDRVAVLVNRHLDPFQFVRNETKGKGYRRLKRDLDSVGLPPEALAQLALADHRGRITDDTSDTEGVVKEFLKQYKSYAEESLCQ